MLVQLPFFWYQVLLVCLGLAIGFASGMLVNNFLWSFTIRLKRFKFTSFNFKKLWKNLRLVILGLLVLFLIFILCGCGAKLINPTENSTYNTSNFFTFSIENKIIVLKLEGLVSLDWADQIEKAFQKDDCLFVIAWIESPGGSATETKLTAHKIRALREKYKKDIIVYSERGLYSGAYWVACEANAIIVAPSGETGSVGVFSVRVDETVADSIKGIKYILIKSGKCKAMWFSHTKLSDEEKNVLQKQIDNLYHEFLQHIYDCRRDQINRACQMFTNLSVNDTILTYYLTRVCDGRGYNANDAFDLGLIDSILYFDELVKKIYNSAPQGTIIVTEDGKKIEDFYPSE